MLTEAVQQELYSLNHPEDCTRAPLLVCSTKVHKFQGSGSRLFYLGRCLAEGLNSRRTVVLNRDLLSTLDMLAPFKRWSNCSEGDTRVNIRKGRDRLYYPMDSESLVKTSMSPAVGALYPKHYAKYGYWWWKAEEISYALRPTNLTLHAFELKRDWRTNESVAVLQIRRTDKTEGCTKTYGILRSSCFLSL